jgi:ABC-type lipoprotein release transport system permease subunit
MCALGRAHITPARVGVPLAIVLVVTTVLATIIPARRAVRVEPMTVLRGE